MLLWDLPEYQKLDPQAEVRVYAQLPRRSIAKYELAQKRKRAKEENTAIAEFKDGRWLRWRGRAGEGDDEISWIIEAKDEASWRVKEAN